ncbi:MAG TPA: hypothetical protein VGH28_10395 [Polyangiaceae bacterium]|jgi:hypothetical protein
MTAAAFSPLEETLVFLRCPACQASLEYGFCPTCQPAAHATSRRLALEAERLPLARVPASTPPSSLADLIERRSDAAQFSALCHALRAGVASYKQQRLAQRLTTARAMQRAIPKEKPE